MGNIRGLYCNWTCWKVSVPEESIVNSVSHETAEILMSEPTAEDIYKAQVAHRYIGALR